MNSSLRRQSPLGESAKQRLWVIPCIIFKEMNRLFSIKNFQSHLATKKFGKNIVFHEEVDSTNDEAKRYARVGKPEGFIVLCDRQTNGKGNFGHSWFSPGKVGLYFSIVIRPQLPLTRIPLLTFLAGVSLLKTIHQETSLISKLKWPNDVMIKGKKICGILTESASSINKVDFVILGIGVNINNSINQFPGEFCGGATSLKIETGNDYSREKFLSSFLICLEQKYNSHIKYGAKNVLDTWRKHNNTLGQEVTICQGNRVTAGLAKDIDDQGNLLVQVKSGAIIKVSSGDMRKLNIISPG